METIVHEAVDGRGCNVHACVAGSIIDEYLAIFIRNPTVGEQDVHHIADIFPSFRRHEESGRLGNDLRRVLKRSHVHIEHIAQSRSTSAHAMRQVQPTLRGLDRMRSLTVLDLLYSMVMTMVDYLLICNHYLFHAVHKRPANAAAVTGVNESVLRTCVEGIFAVHELRMQDDITLLRGRLHVRKTLPVHQVLGASHTSRCYG